MSEMPSHINHILRGHSRDDNLKDLFRWFLSRNQALNRFLLLKEEDSFTHYFNNFHISLISRCTLYYFTVRLCRLLVVW